MYVSRDARGTHLKMLLPVTAPFSSVPAQFFGAGWGLLLTTGLRMTGGAFFFGAGFGALLTDGFGVLDTVEEDLDEPDTEEEEPDELLLFCCDVVLFSDSDRRTSAAFFFVSEEDLLAAAAAALLRESLLLPSPSASTPSTGSPSPGPPLIVIKGISTSFRDFSISVRLALQ